jgi:hypothetical protein
MTANIGAELYKTEDLKQIWSMNRTDETKKDLGFYEITCFFLSTCTAIHFAPVCQQKAGI